MGSRQNGTVANWQNAFVGNRRITSIAADLYVTEDGDRFWAA